MGEMDDVWVNFPDTRAICVRHITGKSILLMDEIVSDPDTIYISVLIAESATTCNPIDKSLMVASASSVYDPDSGSYEAAHAIDNVIIYNLNEGFYRSKHEENPWLKLHFNHSLMTVVSVSIMMRFDCCSDWFKRTSIYVGNEPVVQGQMSRNQKCAYYEGPPRTKAVIGLECEKPISGQYLVIQRVQLHGSQLMINEVEVCGFEGVRKQNLKGITPFYLPNSQCL